MAIGITCPGCEVALNVADNLVGKTIKCKTCGEMIPVRAPAKATARRAAVLDDDEGDASLANASRRFRDDDDDNDSGNSGKKSGGSKALLFGGIAAGALVLLGGGIGLSYLAFGKGTDPQPLVQNAGNNNRSNEEQRSAPRVDDAVKPEEVKKEPVAEKKETKTPEVKKNESTSPVSTEQKGSAPSNPKESDQPKAPPVASSNASPAGQSSEEWNRKMMSGEIDQITLEQSKRATVFIDVEDKFGGGGYGSGWFGIEQNIVITNAHVIGMKSPNSPPPAKITIFMNSGENGQNPGVKQREIPHQRIKIIAVDRFHDIAILEISGETDLPKPFKVQPSAKVKERQGITVLGFPLGVDPARTTGSRKQPSVSVRPSSVTALRYDDFGILRNVQVEGGVNHGNSGGPQIDAEGNVIGMTVSGLGNAFALTQVCFAVPTEHIQGILAGRIDKLTADTAFKDNGMVHIPITISAQDPMKRLKAVGVGFWIGDTSSGIRPPGEVRKGTINSDKDYKEITLTYDPVTKKATGELVFPQLTPGQSYWIQPFYSNTITAKYYMAGIAVDTKGPPVDRVPANLTYSLRQNQVRPFTLTSTNAEEDFIEGDDNGDINEITKYIITMKGTETVLAADTTDSQNAARLRLKYDDCDLTGEEGTREGKILPPQLLLRLKTGIKPLEAFAYVNKSGGIYKSRTSSLAVTDQLAKVLGPPMSTIALGALQECSIPLPNREVKAGETWGGSRVVPYALSFVESVRKSAKDGQPQSPPGSRQRPGGNNSAVSEVGKRDYTFNQEIKFTYEGTRLRGGRSEAVIKYDGKISPVAGKSKDSISGSTKGYAYIDVSSGVIIEAKIESELELDTSLQGLKRRTYSINKYSLTRGGNVK